MVLLNLRPDQVSAAIEALVSVAVIVITVSLSGIATMAKARRLRKSGEVRITPNDFTSGLGHVTVILGERYVSARGLAVMVITAILTVLSSTVLLGTEASRCSVAEGKYGSLSEERETTCYAEKPVPTSGMVPASIIGRLSELVYVEPEVPVRIHPASFDFAHDEITDFSVVPTDYIWGRVLNITSCDHKIEKDDETGYVGTSSDELENLVGSDSFQPSPNTAVWRGRFGFLQEQVEEQTGYVYAKEVRSGGVSKVHLLFAHGDDGAGRVVLENTSCAYLEFDGGGMRVLPLRNAASQLVRRGVDPLRLLEVSWLAATIAEQTPRQKKCRRRNYNINTCTSLSNNTVFTTSAIGLLAVSTLLVSLSMNLMNRRCEVTKVFTRYQLFASAARNQEGGTEIVGKQPNHTRASLTLEGKAYHLEWERRVKSVDENNAEFIRL